jgi:hypothetical protein
MAISVKTTSFWSPEGGSRDQQDRPQSAAPLHVRHQTLTMIPRKSRLKGKLGRHIRRNRSRYLGQHGKLAKIHVRCVKQLDGRVTDYLFKHIKRRTFTLDDVLILPQSLSEARASTNNIPRDLSAPDSRGGREDLNRAISGFSA